RSLPSRNGGKTSFPGGPLLAAGAALPLRVAGLAGRLRRAFSGALRLGLGARPTRAPLHGAAEQGHGGLGGAASTLCFAPHFHQKAARDRRPGFAPFHPSLREREGERLLGARHADVAEPALLLDPAPFAHGALVRKDPFFHPHHVDVRKLEALGAVEGHQSDGVALPSRLFVFVVAIG